MKELVGAKALPKDEAVARWIGKQRSRASAEACVRFALALNNFDIEWLRSALSAAVTYDSQSIYETLRGSERVMQYLQKRIEAFRKAPHIAPRYELGATRMGDPCAIGFFPMGIYDQNWLESPITNVVLKTGRKIGVSSILVITVAPDPRSAYRSGIFPGIDVRSKDALPLEKVGNYAALRFDFYLPDDDSDLSMAMRETASSVEQSFPGAQFFVRVMDQLSTQERVELDKTGFIHFPAVVVYINGEGLYRHSGLIEPEELRRDVQRAAAPLIKVEEG